MVRLVVLVNCFVPIHKSPACYEPVFVSCLFLCWWKHVWIRLASVLSHASVNSHGWNVCTLSSFTPLLKVLIPRQREAAELSCCRLVTLVTVAVQQDPSILTPEAWLNSKPSELPWVTLASSCFFFLLSVVSLLLHLLPEIYTEKLTPTLMLHPTVVMH